MKLKLTFILLFSVYISSAQNSFLKNQFKKRAFYGFESEAEYGIYPAIYKLKEETWIRQRWESSGVTLSYFLRINILEINNNQSISLACNPGLGFRLGSNRQSNNYGSAFYPEVSGMGSLHLPTILNYHLGKGATKNTTSRFGLTISVGKELRLDPLFYSSSNPDDRIALERLSKNYSVSIGLMREKKRLHQFFIRTIVMMNADVRGYNTNTFEPHYDYFYSPKTVSIGLRFYRKN